jgi:hypothetical protein
MRADGVSDNPTETPRRRACAMCGDRVLSELITPLCPCGHADACPPCFLMAWVRQRANGRPHETNMHPSIFPRGVARQSPFTPNDHADLVQFATDVAIANHRALPVESHDAVATGNFQYTNRFWLDEDYDDLLAEEYWDSYADNQQLYETQVTMMLQSMVAVDDAGSLHLQPEIGNGDLELAQGEEQAEDDRHMT